MKGGGSFAVILIDPQMADNIGATARAMLNCELEDLRLVRPRDGWPNPAAYPAAAGADHLLDQAQSFPTTREAVADLRCLYAATARRRGMTKRIVGPRRAAHEIRTASQSGEASGVLFGPERSGLVNDDVTLADAVIEISLNPGFHSLNLAQAVLLIGWEFLSLGKMEGGSALARPDEAMLASAHPPASKEELLQFFLRLESALDETGFLSPAHKRAVMVRNLRNLLGRARPTEQEVRTLHGVVTALAGEGAGFRERGQES